jgi:hypothetical protein
MTTDDVDDEYTERIDAASPTRSGSHKQYAIAMQMVGNRHSKGALVGLINWLLVERPVLPTGSVSPQFSNLRQCEKCGHATTHGRLLHAVGCENAK